MHMNRKRSRPRIGFHPRPFAFTLVELLTVVAIIAVLSGLSVRILGGLGNGGNGPRGGSALAASILGTAREEAIMRRTTARLVIDTINTPSNSANYLHRLTVVYLSPSTTSIPAATGTNWLQANKWEALPANTYVYYGSQNGQNSGTTPSGSDMQIAFNGTVATTGTGYDYIEFNPAGQVTPPAAYPNGTRVQLIVAPGFINSSSGSLQVTSTNQLFGFAVFRLGRTTFFQDELSMQNP
jgi:prepilin-type N-terminal cleavage/methylation domain-containing protein